MTGETISRKEHPLIEHRGLAARMDDLERKYDARFRVVFDAIPGPDGAAKAAGKADRVLTNVREEYGLKTGRLLPIQAKACIISR